MMNKNQSCFGKKELPSVVMQSKVVFEISYDSRKFGVTPGKLSKMASSAESSHHNFGNCHKKTQRGFQHNHLEYPYVRKSLEVKSLGVRKNKLVANQIYNDCVCVFCGNIIALIYLSHLQLLR